MLGSQLLRRPYPGLVVLVLAALVVGGAPSVVDAAPSHSVATTRGSSAPRDLLAGHALVAGTKHSELHNGRFTLDVYSGTVELDETIPVATAHGPTSSSTGTWFRDDTTGRFQASHDHTVFRLTRTGDLTLVTAHGRRLWHSGTEGSGGVRLTLHRSGDLALHTRSGKVVWSSHSGHILMSGGMTLPPGHRLRDAWETAFPRGVPVTLTMQRDGNLVHRCGSRIDWQSHTHVAGSTMHVYRRGGMRILAPSGRAVWSTGSGGKHDGAWFDAKFMEILSGAEPIWHARLDYRVC